jgi:membrane-bound lytic murein transglycosylase A
VWRALVLMLALGAGAGQAQELRFADLDGWAADDHGAALAAFRVTCNTDKARGLKAACAAAASATDARTFFEAEFRLVAADAPALYTGYYEPEFQGSPVRTPRFAWPVYAKPPEFDGRGQWHSREVIERQGLLRGRGLELAWLEDPVDVFHLHVQGSGRVRMPDGAVLRLGFAAKNNHPFRSVARELARRGAFPVHAASTARVRAWVRDNGQAGVEALYHNPSFIFFRKLPDLPPERGPVGAMGRSLTALRSIAVDPGHVPMGAPVWVEKDGAEPLRRLMIAQDAGTAIKGPGRGDIFYGSGPEAGRSAARVKDRGRMVVLVPRRPGG